MKRKVVQQGPATLMVSLPSKWAKKYGINKGDEVDIEEKGTILEILAQKNPVGKDIFLDITDFDRTTLTYYLRYNYRNGSNIISLKFKEPIVYHHRYDKPVKVISVINEEVGRLMGMEIIEQKQNSCLIKCMLNEDIKDFDDFLRKVFFLIKDSYNELISCLDSGRDLEEIQHNHNSVTRFISYCTRLLNKFGYKEYKKTIFLHSMLESLEIIMDILEDTSRKISLERLDITKNSFPLIEKMSSFFNEFTEFYYNFNVKKATELNKYRIDIEKSIKEIKKGVSGDERMIISELSAILIILRDIIGVRIGLEY